MRLFCSVLLQKMSVDKQIRLFISILIQMWEKLVGKTGKACYAPEEERERREGTAKAFRELSLYSAKVFGRHKRDFWSKDEKVARKWLV